ncbi:MAG: MFS transporter, partial [Pseudomonadota bacterium]|nr:MFS transporter [Pseudomonadota bacterium]
MIRELLGLREFRFFLAANVAERFAASALTVLIGFQIFEITGRTLFVGLLGLTEAIPGIGLVLLGGEFADRHDRRAIMLRTTTLLAFLAIVLAVVARLDPAATLPALFGVAFLSATVRAFESPAASGLEARIVPLHLVFRGVPILATTARTADVLGPVIVGFAWAYTGPATTYAGLATLFLLASTLLRIGVAPKPPLARAVPG